MRVGILGLGFVGLTTGLALADKKFDVLAYDIDKTKRSKINSCSIPFFEPKLENKLKLYLNKNFKIKENFSDIINLSDIIFICVGTPSKKNGSANLKYLNNIFSKIKITNQNKKKIFCIKSTIPPGTCDYIKSFYDVNNELSICFYPEFLREGFAWDDFMNPDRIVLGVNTKNNKTILNSIFKKFSNKIYYTTYREAELLKYASNTLLANLISYSNEISMIANSIGDINISKIFKLLHMDKRWVGNPAKMSSYVYPGLGFGGYCLPKDLKALINIAKQKNIDPLILKAVNKTNSKIKSFNFKKIINQISNKKSNIGIYGLAFKEGSDDVRDTPSYYYIKNLKKKGYENIFVYDELALASFKKKYPELKINYLTTIYKLIKKADILILMKRDKVIEKLILTNYKNKIIDLKYLL